MARESIRVLIVVSDRALSRSVCEAVEAAGCSFYSVRGRGESLGKETSFDCVLLERAMLDEAVALCRELSQPVLLFPLENGESFNAAQITLAIDSLRARYFLASPPKQKSKRSIRAKANRNI
ncbi:MAG: hypothetical protein Q4B42_05300 [Oscillospiraceae bacterium]|nr:hypothetical protein [Oscillospiraceae bacterium]